MTVLRALRTTLAIQSRSSRHRPDIYTVRDMSPLLLQDIQLTCFDARNHVDNRHLRKHGQRIDIVDALHTMLLSMVQTDKPAEPMSTRPSLSD